MRNAAFCLLATFFVARSLSYPLYGESDQSEIFSTAEPSSVQQSEPQKPFTSFTGRTLRNKVRIRLQPTLDAPILREINKGDLFVVVGEMDDFYAIEAPSDIKGYVFRTYVLDNVVEGNHVNVRLEPNLEAPVIANLNAGDKIDGQISPINSKWLEITPPNSTRFYIAKEYVEKVGDSSFKVVLDKKREQGAQLLNNAFTAGQTELSKPWNQINLDGVNTNLNKIIKDYPEFPEMQSKAKESLTMIQESYFQKKVEYLETLAKNSDRVSAQNKELSNKVLSQERRISELEQSNQPHPADPSSASSVPVYSTNTTNPVDRMNSWLPVENQLYESWAETHENQPISAFYDDQMQNAKTLKGIIQLYDRSVRNKPGDFVLLNPTSRIPTAYLYSTQVNLQSYVGKEITVKVAPRENNNFAYPAYFVLSVE